MTTSDIKQEANHVVQADAEAKDPPSDNEDGLEDDQIVPFIETPGPICPQALGKYDEWYESLKRACKCRKRCYAQLPMATWVQWRNDCNDDSSMLSNKLLLLRMIGLTVLRLPIFRVRPALPYVGEVCLAFFRAFSTMDKKSCERHKKLMRAGEIMDPELPTATPRSSKRRTPDSRKDAVKAKRKEKRDMRSSTRIESEGQAGPPDEHIMTP